MDGHLIDGDDVAMGNVLRETSLRSCSREEAMKPAPLWSVSPVLILIRNQLKCCSYISVYFDYKESLILMRNRLLTIWFSSVFRRL